MTVADSSLTPPSDSSASPREEAALPREERRRRTEATILEAARELFAEVGFERTTIRAVAGRAGVDPALVMQYYGNKEGLFAASARWTAHHKQMFDAALEDIPATALADLFERFADPSTRDASIALLRNCLTHDTARRIMRDDVMCERQASMAATIGGPDADLRAALVGTVMMGLSLGRFLLEIPALAAASREDVERVLLPALTALTEG